jgi:molybdate transport system substrate-binding protein
MNSSLLTRLVLVAAACLLFACCHSSGTSAEKGILVAAAADLGPAFEEIGHEYEKTTGTKVTFSFGSTGTLAKQIENGAPMDLFAAANIEFIDRLQKKGLIIPETKALYARGRITLWKHADSKLQIDKLQDLTRLEVRKVGIANPEHAPYGTAAREAMQALGIWDQVKDKMVFAENVRMALQYAETGNTDASVVALSLSLQSKGHWVLIPEELHKPLDQALAVMKDTNNEQEARRFAAFINGAQGRPIMRRYGFTLPGEEPGK